MKENCLIKSEFTIYSSSQINHAELTKLLGYEPTKIWSKGDTIRKTLIAKESGWLFSSGDIESLCVEDVISIILNALNDKVMLLSDYLKNNNLKIKFDIIIKTSSSCFPSLYYSKELIKTCYILDADIETDVFISN